MATRLRLGAASSGTAMPRPRMKVTRSPCGSAAVRRRSGSRGGRRHRPSEERFGGRRHRGAPHHGCSCRWGWTSWAVGRRRRAPVLKLGLHAARCAQHSGGEAPHSTGKRASCPSASFRIPVSCYPPAVRSPLLRWLCVAPFLLGACDAVDLFGDDAAALEAGDADPEATDGADAEEAAEAEAEAEAAAEAKAKESRLDKAGAPRGRCRAAGPLPRPQEEQRDPACGMVGRSGPTGSTGRGSTSRRCGLRGRAVVVQPGRSAAPAPPVGD